MTCKGTVIKESGIKRNEVVSVDRQASLIFEETINEE